MLSKESLTIIRASLVACEEQLANLIGVLPTMMAEGQEMSEEMAKDMVILRQRLVVIQNGIEVIDAELFEMEEDHDKAIIDP